LRLRQQPYPIAACDYIYPLTEKNNIWQRQILRRPAKVIEALARGPTMEADNPKIKIVQPAEGLEYNVMGAMMTYKATAYDTRGAYSLAIEVTPPHGGLPLHVHHREDEAMYILEGEYEIQCGDQVFRATAGTFVFLPKDVPNRYQNAGGEPGKFLYITSPGGFEKLVEQTSLLASAGPPDMQKVMDAAGAHGIEFIHSGNG
jgi:mannose-6-phosphate isomerase-like protein (cupin superfamily)